MWYCVFFDAWGDDDIIESHQNEPPEQEQNEMSQTVGFHFAGCFQANSENEALQLAEQSFDGGGCVA